MRSLRLASGLSVERLARRPVLLAQIAGGDTYRYGDRDLIAEVTGAVEWWRHNGRPLGDSA